MLQGYLMPHPPLLVQGVGKGNEIPQTRAAFEQIAAEIQAIAPDTVIFISPHSTLYADYFHISPGADASGDFGSFGAPQLSYRVTYDTVLAERLAATAAREGLFAGGEGERNPHLDHGVLVPLHFLHQPLQILRLSFSGCSLQEHYRYGRCIREAAAKLQRKIVIIASGDMSHKLSSEEPYGFAPEGPAFDALVRQAIQKSDLTPLLQIDPQLPEAAAECGLRSLIILAGAFDGYAISATLLSYEGPFGVGYLSASFTAGESVPSLEQSMREAAKARLAESRAGEDAFVRLARLNTESYIREGERIALPDDLPLQMLQQRAGVFVSIKKDGVLRGCIGTIAATTSSIATEILRNSVAAAVDDPRFAPISSAELAELTYSVDVLGPTEAIASAAELDPQRYGVIVSCGRRRGLLLPMLEGITTVQEQIAVALQKAGIKAQEPYTLERFEVVRHAPTI